MYSLVSDNIVFAQVDAIVNAANPSLLGGGGVDGAIHKAAGPVLLEACRHLPEITKGVRCPFGEARITPAGCLSARYVIHSVGPIYSQSRNPSSVLASAYQSSLALAVEYQCQSLAFPAISCGVYGYPWEEAASIAFDQCEKPQYQSLDICFYLLDMALFDCWSAVYRERNLS